MRLAALNACGIRVFVVAAGAATATAGAASVVVVDAGAGMVDSGLAPPHAAIKRAGARTRSFMVLVDNMAAPPRTRGRA